MRNRIPRDIFIRIDIRNRHNKRADITVLPTLWFYNRWRDDGMEKKPVITSRDKNSVRATHSRLGSYYLYFQLRSTAFSPRMRPIPKKSPERRIRRPL